MKINLYSILNIEPQKLMSITHVDGHFEVIDCVEQTQWSPHLSIGIMPGKRGKGVVASEIQSEGPVLCDLIE